MTLLTPDDGESTRLPHCPIALEARRFVGRTQYPLDPVISGAPLR